MSSRIPIGSGRLPTPPLSCLWLLTLVGACLWSPLAVRAQSPARPRIVNGVLDADSPAVGAVLELGGPRDFVDRIGACTGTLIGCSTFVIAAHCVCDEIAFTAAECASLGATPPERLAVFLPQAGIFPVASVDVAPDFDFERSGDIAVLRLVQSVDGIEPMPLYRGTKLPFGSAATIVGYGTTSEDSYDGGLKRIGGLLTGACPAQIEPANHLCWTYDSVVGEAGVDSNTCYGDSGGPLLVTRDGLVQLAGITSGGEPTCDPGSRSWNTDVTTELSFLDASAGDDLTSGACGDLAPIGSEYVSVKSYTLDLDARSGGQTREFVLPAGIARLRVGLNGVEYTSGPFARENDFDLYVNAGSAAEVSGSNTCSDETTGTWAFCDIAAPAAGTWHLRIEPATGRGQAQLTVTAIGAPAPICTGDCDGNGVTVDEIVRGINIALGEAEIATCGAFDADGSGSVTVDEILLGLTYALEGCPS